MRRRMRMRRSRRTVHRRSRRRFSRSSAKAGIWTLAGRVAPAVAFLEQLTGKGRAAGKYNGSMIQNAQTLANNVTGNIFGFNIFSGGQKFTQQINPSGIANKYTGIGLASVAAGMILPKLGVRIPGAGKIFSLGRKMLVPGIVGGFFDDAPQKAYYNNQSAMGTTSSYQAVYPQSSAMGGF